MSSRLTHDTFFTGMQIRIGTRRIVAAVFREGRDDR